MGGKRTVFVVAVLAVTGGWVGATVAGPVLYTPTGTLGSQGWTLAGTPGDGLAKSRDFSSLVDDGGPAWNINDNNQPQPNAYMRMWKDPSADNQNPADPPMGTVDWSQGIVLARVKYISGSTNGTFGWTIGGHNMSVMVGVRNGVLAIKDAEGNSSAIANPTVPGGTFGYRVYALQNHLVGGVPTFDLWVSNGDDWSTNAADWTQLVDEGSYGTGAISALVDQTSTARTGLLLGATGSSSGTWQGNVSKLGRRTATCRLRGSLPRPCRSLVRCYCWGWGQVAWSGGVADHVIGR